MKKKILIPILTALAITSCTLYQSYKINITKDAIKNQVITEINENKRDNSDTTKYSMIEEQIKSNRMTILDTSYLISINNISNEELHKTKIEGYSYLSYNFDAEVTFSKNNKTYTKNITSSVIVDKKDNIIEIKSLDDLEQDLLKALIQIKKDNSEDYSEELNTLSLVYQNEELDIQINYPDYYTYSSLKTQNENITEHNVSFYMDSDKTTNYIQFVMSTNNSRTKLDYIEELKEQGYMLQEKKLVTQSDIEFSILKQIFTQNFKEVTETIYIANSKYKNIDNLIITTKLDSTLLKTREIEIEEIIKSIK